MSLYAKKQQSGNILFYIFIAIALLALLTQWVARESQTQSDTISRQTQDTEIAQMQTYEASLAAALDQMITNGEDPTKLYTDLDVNPPGTGTYANGINNKFKIFHPLGGGIQYMAASSASATPMATAFNIVPGAIITGVGQTDVTVGDIVFTAQVSTAAYCQRINQILNGSTTVPVMATATFNTLFVTGSTVTVDAAACASCVKVPKLCVTNTGGTAWGYYSALYPDRAS